MKNLFSYRSIAQYTLLVLVVSYTAFLQFYHLGKLAIVQWDESRLAVNAAEMYQSRNYLVSTYEGRPDLYNTKPPLMIWLQVASIHVFGLNEFAIRFPSALAGFICIMLCGYILYRRERNIFPASLAMLLLACSNGFIQLHGSLTGDFDSLLALWILLAFYQFYNAFAAGENRDSKKYFLLFLSLAVMTKSAAALIAFPVFIILSIPQGNFKKVMEVLVYCLLSVLPFALYCFFREQASAGYLNAILYNDFGGRFSKAMEGHTSEWHYYIVNLFDYRFHYFIWLLPPALVFAFIWKDRLFRYYSLALICFLVFLSIPKTRIHWYDTPALPLVALVVAMFAGEIYKYLKMAYMKIAYICLVCFHMLIPIKEKYQFIAQGKGLELDLGHYELSDMLRYRTGNEDVKYIAHHYDAEFYFYTKTNPRISRGKFSTLKPLDIVAMGNLYKDSVRSRYTYTLLDSTQNAQKIRITGIK